MVDLVSYRFEGTTSLGQGLTLLETSALLAWKVVRRASVIVTVELPDEPALYDALTLGSYRLDVPRRVGVGRLKVSAGALIARSELRAPAELTARLSTINGLDTSLDPFRVSIDFVPASTDDECAAELKLDPRLSTLTVRAKKRVRRSAYAFGWTRPSARWVLNSGCVSSSVERSVADAVCGPIGDGPQAAGARRRRGGGVHSRRAPPGSRTTAEATRSPAMAPSLTRSSRAPTGSTATPTR